MNRLFLPVVFVLFLFLRLYNYSNVLNFSTDQAVFSLKAREIWQTKKPTLIGPTFSVNVDGRYAFQGPAIYYVQLFFLVVGGWDPMIASALFTLFAGMMIWPLYKGSEYIVGQLGAKLLVCVYAFLPLYLEYTRFLWNPNFQLALFPVAIFLFGKYHFTHKKIWLYVFAFFLGFLLQFHYQLLVICFAVAAYFLRKKTSIKDFLVSFVAFCLGFSPLILFELRHNFYNMQTILLFVKNIFLEHASSSGVTFQPHYILTISFALFVILVVLIAKKLRSVVVFGAGAILFICSVVITLSPTSRAFGMAENWNYPKEKKATEYIFAQQQKDYRVINLLYDTQAAVQIYELQRHGEKQDWQNYENSPTLFVIATEDQLKNSQAYELTTFTPRREVKKWQIDDAGHFVWLFERVDSE